MRKVSGFTIIELVVVITILGILAAVALPKFFALDTQARISAGAGVAGGISSGTAINYGARIATGTAATATGPVYLVNACTSAVLGTVMTGGLPAGYTVADGTTVTFGANGEQNNCLIIPAGTVTGVANNGTATAYVIAVIN